MATCGTCGFLSQRAQWEHGPMPGFYEVQVEARTTDPAKARRLHLPTVPTLELKANLACYRQVAVFPGSELTVNILDTDPDRARRALSADRECKEWCEHVPGFDPKELLMELRMQQLESDRRSAGRGLVILGLILAAAQVATMTSDSILYKTGAAIYEYVASALPRPQAR